MNRRPMKTTLISLTFAVLIACASSAIAAGGEKLTMPDFTKGDTIPANAKHDWNLGPTGLRGWMFCDKLVTSDARQIAVTKVEEKSPAEGVIAVGDVILGVAGKPFSFDPRTEMGSALKAAETEAGGGACAPDHQEIRSRVGPALERGEEERGRRGMFTLKATLRLR